MTDKFVIPDLRASLPRKWPSQVQSDQWRCRNVYYRCWASHTVRRITEPEVPRVVHPISNARQEHGFTGNAEIRKKSGEMWNIIGEQAAQDQQHLSASPERTTTVTHVKISWPPSYVNRDFDHVLKTPSTTVPAANERIKMIKSRLKYAIISFMCVIYNITRLKVIETYAIAWIRVTSNPSQLVVH